MLRKHEYYKWIASNVSVLLCQALKKLPVNHYVIQKKEFYDIFTILILSTHSMSGTCFYSIAMARRNFEHSKHH